MTSDEEDKYFEQKQAEWREDVRREKRLQAIREEEREAIAENLDTSEKIAEEALELGFDQETALLLPLVPMIQVAWADGSVSIAERHRLEELMEQFGVEPGSEAANFLDLMLEERPSETFFKRVNRVVAHLLEENPDEWSSKSIVEHAREVAEASGGFFGLGDPVSSGEHELLGQFAELFSIEEAEGEQLIDPNDE
jgi:hypothetical protein